MRRLKSVMLVPLGLVAVYFAYHLTLSLMVRKRINSIRRAGFPATCAELDKWYVQPPAGQNAADLYREAFAHFDQWTNKLAESSIPADFVQSDCSSPPKVRRDLLPVVGLAKLPPKTGSLPADMRQLVAEYLADNGEALRLLHQAAAMKSCRYPVDLTDGFAHSFGAMASLRQAERLLSLEAILNSSEQRPQQAVESVIASLAVAHSLKQEPTLISYLVELACQGLALESVERVLDQMPLTDEQLVQLDAALRDSENQLALTRALVGERCCGENAFVQLRTGKIPPDDLGNLDDETYWTKPLWPLYKGAGLLDLDEIAFLDIMGQ
jgi:hypothetical protein